MIGPLRYGVSRHAHPGDPHWDLFVQADPDAERLPTWRLMVLPWELPPGGIGPAERIFDHRSAYLDWSGELSDRRGSVTPVESGSVEWLTGLQGDETGWVGLRLTRPTGEVLWLVLPGTQGRHGQFRRRLESNPARSAT